MVQTGLDTDKVIKFPAGLTGKRIGILCHAPSVTSDFTHITRIFFDRKECCLLTAIFGPQHGLYRTDTG